MAEEIKEGKEGEELSIEAGFARVSELLEQMQAEGTDLEAGFALYQEGVSLLKNLSERIDRVEKKVQLLSEDGSTTDFEE